MQPGHLILLNGTSSAGKTTLLHTLQQLLPGPYLNAGIDKLLWMLPGRYLDAPLWENIFVPEVSSRPRQAPTPGEQVIRTLPHVLSTLLRQGHNVIADHVLIRREWLEQLAGVLRDQEVLFVGVRCPLEVVEERERHRKDRTLGQARAQYHAVHAHGRYDLEVDTSVMDVETCAQRIKARLDKGFAGTVLRELAGADAPEGAAP